MWMREGSQLLINIGRRAPECRAPQDAADLIQSLERFVEQGKPLQEQRLQKISELSLQLYGQCLMKCLPSSSNIYLFHFHLRNLKSFSMDVMGNNMDNKM